MKKAGILFLSVMIGLSASCSDGRIDLGNEDEVRTQASGTIATWAGDGTQGFDGDGNHRTESWFYHPMEMAFAPDGSAYILDWNNHRVRHTTTDETLETVVGKQFPSDWPCADPSDLNNCDVPMTETLQGLDVGLNHPQDILFAPTFGDVAHIAAWHNHKVERYNTSTGELSVLAGSSVGFSGDSGPALSAKFNFVSSLVADSAGNIFVSDQRNNRIRRIANDSTRTIITVAGSGPAAFSGDGGPATAAKFALTAYNDAGGADNPNPGGGLALDAAGNLYVADTSNHCVRKISHGGDGVISGDVTETITTVAGTCGQTGNGYSGNGGSAVSAKLNLPSDLEVGPDGRLYIAEVDNHVVRAVDLATGIINTVAGTGVKGFSGDGGQATLAQLRSPYGIAFDATGNLYIVDTENNRIRVVAK